MIASTDPIRVILTRGAPESVHLVDAVVSTVDGPEKIWGDPDASVIPRSAIKFIQALPLIRTGAADAFDVSSIELALSAASHSGEPEHVAAVGGWLERIGLTEADLECGADRPLGRAAAEQLAATGAKGGQLHNCCSGKHAGFLTIARHLGVDTAGYIERDHPVQELVTEAIEEFVGIDVGSRPSGIDGCGIPTFSFPVHALAMAMARFGEPRRSADPAAVARLSGAIATNTWWLSGSGRPEVQLGEAASESVLLKVGAEGVFMGLAPDRRLGIALKSRDGADRGATAAIAAVLEHLGIVPSGTSRTELCNKAGTVVGEQFVELS